MRLYALEIEHDEVRMSFDTRVSKDEFFDLWRDRLGKEVNVKEE